MPVNQQCLAHFQAFVFIGLYAPSDFSTLTPPRLKAHSTPLRSRIISDSGVLKSIVVTLKKFYRIMQISIYLFYAGHSTLLWACRYKFRMQEC